MTIIDFHTHAFPDDLAERAVPALEASAPGATAHLDGKISSLVRSMDEAGIARTVVASIATRPKQFASILKWSQAVASDRIVPFPSFHPADPEAPDRVRQIRDAGLLGIKLHPYYQEFDLDDERMWPIYEAIQETGLIWLCHTGYDIAFPRFRRCDPARIATVADAFPGIMLVTSHIGAWQEWEAVREHMLGRPIYMEISYSLPFMSREEARGLLLGHGQDYVLFGSDSPWGDQKQAIADLRALELGAEREAAILGGNGLRLLGEA